jgi:ADP-ribose pyrophosphatase YjhB (NUDIX family)
MGKPQRLRVGAYGLAIAEDQILLSRLSAIVSGWAGYWTLPGGGIEFGESPEAAVVREFEEETGLIVEPLSVATIDTISHSRSYEEYHGIRIIYHVRVLGGELRYETEGSSDMCAWKPLYPTDTSELVDLAKVGLTEAQRHHGLSPATQPDVRSTRSA